jgi:hypothetical protein
MVLAHSETRGVSFFHRHPGILHKHLRAFAATPSEIVEEVLPADAVRAGWGIDFGLASRYFNKKRI